MINAIATQRADKVLAQVAAGMQDYDALLNALDHALWLARRDGDQSAILIDICSAIERSNYPPNADSREVIAIRLLNSLESYARSALTDVAESDIPLEDEESDE